MIKQIIGTTTSRVLITICGLAILVLNTQYLGAQKMGLLAFYLIGLNLIIQLSELIGGSSLVLLQKNYHTSALLKTSYVWALLVSVIAVFVSFLWDVPTLELSLVIGAAFIQSINHSHLHLLVGKERIGAYNRTTLLQSIVVLIILTWFYFSEGTAEVSDYLLAYLSGQGLLFVTTLYNIDRSDVPSGSNSDGLITALFSYGFLIQLANVFQFGVYRINYLILEQFTNTRTLGIFSLGNQLSEKALIPSNAISMVQYTKIANEEDLKNSTILTIDLLAISMLVSLVSVLLLVLIPANLIATVFGMDFKQAQEVFVYLGPGIVFMSASLIYSHFFAGLGKYFLNTMTSLLGLATIIGLSYFLIPKYGMIGAAIASSIVFLIQALAQFIIFKKITQLSWKSLTELHVNSIKKLSFKRVINGLR